MLESYRSFSVSGGEGGEAALRAVAVVVAVLIDVGFDAAAAITVAVGAGFFSESSSRCGTHAKKDRYTIVV